MIFGLLYFSVVILCVNRSRSSFILYRIVKRHSRQSNVRRIWTCADNEDQIIVFKLKLLHKTKMYSHGLSTLLMQNPYSKFVLSKTTFIFERFSEFLQVIL